MGRRDGNKGHEFRRSKMRSRPRPMDVDAVFYDIRPAIRSRSRGQANTFSRHLFGFNEQTLAKFFSLGLEDVDREGFVPVRFTGVSQKPAAEIECTKVRYTRDVGGHLVVSSVVAIHDLREIGRDGPIRQVDEPEMTGHNSRQRFNVALGSGRFAISNAMDLASLGDKKPLTLSAVVEINGKPLEPGVYAEELWN